MSGRKKGKGKDKKRSNDRITLTIEENGNKVVLSSDDEEFFDAEEYTEQEKREKEIEELEKKLREFENADDNLSAALQEIFKGFPGIKKSVKEGEVPPYVAFVNILDMFEATGKHALVANKEKKSAWQETYMKTKELKDKEVINKKLEDTLNKIQKELIGKNAELLQKDEVCKQFKIQARELEDEIERLKADLSIKSRLLTGLQNEIDKLQKEIEELKRQLDQRLTIEVQQKHVEEMQRIKEENEELKKRISGQDRKITELQTNLAKIKNLEKQIQALEGKLREEQCLAKKKTQETAEKSFGAGVKKTKSTIRTELNKLYNEKLQAKASIEALLYTNKTLEIKNNGQAVVVELLRHQKTTERVVEKVPVPVPVPVEGTIIQVVEKQVPVSQPPTQVDVANAVQAAIANMSSEELKKALAIKMGSVTINGSTYYSQIQQQGACGYTP